MNGYSSSYERIVRYAAYCRTDLNLLKTSKYDVVNGNIADHLAQIYAFAKSSLLLYKRDELTKLLHNEHLISLFTDLTIAYDVAFCEKTGLRMLCDDFYETAQKLRDMYYGD